MLFATPWIVACTTLLCPWDFQGKSTGVGCHFLLQGIFPTQGSNPSVSHCRQTLYRLSHQGSQGAPGINLKREALHGGRCSSLNESGPTTHLLRPQAGRSRVGQNGPEREGWWEARAGRWAVRTTLQSQPAGIRQLRVASRGGRRRPLAASSAPCCPQPAALRFRRHAPLTPSSSLSCCRPYSYWLLLRGCTPWDPAL